MLHYVLLHRYISHHNCSENTQPEHLGLCHRYYLEPILQILYNKDLH